MQEDKDRGFPSTDVSELLYWGGIVRPSVLRQKDFSFLSIIAYEPFSIPADKSFLNQKFCRGWGMWNEHQQAEDGTAKDYLVVFWHPFSSAARLHVENTLGKKVRKDNASILDYFEEEVQKIVEEMKTVTEARLLEYQEILDVLSFSITLKRDVSPKMPDIPLYLDALLSQDLEFRFTANDIYVDGKRVFIVSLLSGIDTDRLYGELSHAYPGGSVAFRHTRRFMFFDEKQAEDNLKKYSVKWFPARSVLRNMALHDITSTYNGYLTETFLAYLTEEQEESFVENFSYLLDSMEVAYRIEEFNLKQVFWGAILGNYQANQYPPIVGLRSLAELMTARIEEKKKEESADHGKRQLIQTTINVQEFLEEDEGGEED